MQPHRPKPGRTCSIWPGGGAPWPMRQRPSNDAEAARMREFARTVTDPEVLSEVYAMMEEWERRARLHDNGDAG